SADGFYSSGTAVQLTATANASSQFSSWSGDLTGSLNPQALIMNMPRNVTASFSGTQAGPPAITSMNPNPVPALNGNQTVTINGSGFVNGVGLKVHLVIGATGSDVSGAQLTFLSSTQITISFNFGASNANWTAQVINPDAQGSNVFSFTVSIQSTATVCLPQ